MGSFRYLRAEDHWEWSEAVAHMHGYAPGKAMTGQGRPFSGRHRIVDVRGCIHPVVVIGERLCDDGAAVEDAIADFTEHRALPQRLLLSQREE